MNLFEKQFIQNIIKFFLEVFKTTILLFVLLMLVQFLIDKIM